MTALGSPVAFAAFAVGDHRIAPIGDSLEPPLDQLAAALAVPDADISVAPAPDADVVEALAEASIDLDLALGQAGARADAWHEVLAVVPDGRATVRLVASLPPGGAEVDDEQWRVLARVGGGRPVAELAPLLVIVHFAIAGAGTEEKAAAGMLWAAILFTAVLSLNRCFTADQEEGALDALQLAPIDRAAIWLGKVIAQVAFLLIMEAVALPAFWLFFFGEKGPDPLPVIAAVLLANIGLAAVGVLVAGLAQATRARDVLLPVLFLPLSIPLVIGAVTATLGAFPDGGGSVRALEFLVVFNILFTSLAWGTFEHLSGE